MAAMLLFWNTNVAAVTSCEYAQLPLVQPESSRIGSCLFNVQFCTSYTIIKMIHIHSFDPEGAKIYQSLYLLYFHLLNSHWPLAFASLMFILTSLLTISSFFFFNCLAYCHGCLELLLLIVGGEHFRRKTLDQRKGHERSSKPCV